jgi:hypothetical protein
MPELQQLLERTEWLQDQIEALHQPIHQLQTQLCDLHEKLASWRVQESSPELVKRDQDAPALGSLPMADDGGLERRTMPRQRGNPAPIRVGHPHLAMENLQGWVIDRSPDGICLILDEAVAAGTILNIQPVHHLANMSWFQVEVKNCRPERTIWILGCQFMHRLSWNELRLFG